MDSGRDLPPASVATPAPPLRGVQSWLEAYYRWSDRLLTSPRFQRWATRSLLARPIARRRSRALFDLCAGFAYSQVLLACVRLGVFHQLAQEPRTPADLAAAIGLPATATERLLRAAASLELAALRPGGRYGLGILGAALVGNPCLLDLIRHHELLYADLADPVALLRDPDPDTRVRRYWAYARAGTAGQLTATQVQDYSRLMASSQALIAAALLDGYDFSPHRRLLDVGGGLGSFVARVARRHAHLELGLFDLPPVVALAREALAAEGLELRVRLTAGDFHRDPLPGGADVVTLLRVLHDHDDPAALALLRSIRQVLDPQGVLVVAEPMAGVRGVEPVGDAYFGLYLWAMGQGRARTAREIRALAEAAGFRRCRFPGSSAPLVAGIAVLHP